MPRVVLFLGQDPLTSYDLDGRPLEVGRAPGNDVVVPDAAVSDYHLVLRTSAAGLVAIDRSGGGLPTADGRAERVPLAPGDRIALGRFALQIVASTVEAAEEGGTSTLVRPRGRSGAGLTLQVAEKPVRAFPLRRAELCIGTAKENDVVLGDPCVSARHCRIEPSGRSSENAFVVRDLASRNGTFVNGIRVVVAELGVGTRLTVGKTELCVRAEPDLDALGLIGRSESLAAVRSAILRFAPLRGSVLIAGETGSGKEVVARALHRASGRRDRPFVAINCAALSADLIESELFGHERGAFTGAAVRHIGAFEQASTGTLFLDEIADLPWALQAKLLRVLEARTVRRIGAEHDVPVDVRIVSATHVDLREAVARRQFREDLYHRLAVCRLSLPPLRERPEDVDTLARHLLQDFAGELGAHTVSDSALMRLRGYPWPGNVRELRNVLYRAAIDAQGPTVVSANVHLDDWVPAKVGERDDALLMAALERNGGVVARAARELGVARETLRDRIRHVRGGGAGE